MNIKSLKSEFNKNVLRLFSASALANIISVLSLIILARLYTKDQFGYLQIYLSTITTFSVISAFKYEVAIVLPKSDDEARTVTILSLLSLLLFTFAISLAFLLFGEFFLSAVKAKELQPYIIFICLGVFLMGLWQILQYVLIRNKRFDILARNKVFQVSVTQSVAILIGLNSPSFIALITAQLLGLFLASILILVKFRISLEQINLKKILALLVFYKKFPLVNTPMVFLNTLSIQLPVFMFIRYFNPDVVGLYMMANRLLMTPLRMVGKSVSQVYFQAASEAYHQGKQPLLKIYLQTVKKLSLIATLPILAIIFFAPLLVDLFLGPKWTETGVFMQVMTAYVFFQFITSPISGTFSIINRQEVAFILILFSLVSRFLAMYIFRGTHLEMLIAFSVSAALFYLCYIVFIYYYIKKLNIIKSVSGHD